MHPLSLSLSLDLLCLCRKNLHMDVADCASDAKTKDELVLPHRRAQNSLPSSGCRSGSEHAQKGVSFSSEHDSLQLGAPAQPHADCNCNSLLLP